MCTPGIQEAHLYTSGDSMRVCSTCMLLATKGGIGNSGNRISWYVGYMEKYAPKGYGLFGGSG